MIFGEDGEDRPESAKPVKPRPRSKGGQRGRRVMQRGKGRRSGRR